MRKLIALSMLCLVLGTQTEIRQLLRLPALFEHYREHRRGNPSLSFLSFLRMHYENMEVDGDYWRDQQLPFRDLNIGMTLVLMDTPPAGIRIERTPLSAIVHAHTPNRNGFVMQCYQHDIFQPPRTA